MSIVTWDDNKPHFKPSKLEARMARDTAKQEIRDKEDRHKSAARKRDNWMCRFPRCVCHDLRLHPEVAHVVSKGMGGDHGERSHVSGLICLCKPRHQESRISLHRGTLRVDPVTEAGTNGPVRWLANIAVLDDAYTTSEVWTVLATESRPGVLEPLNKVQVALLERIRELEA